VPKTQFDSWNDRFKWTALHSEQESYAAVSNAADQEIVVGDEIWVDQFDRINGFKKGDNYFLVYET